MPSPFLAAAHQAARARRWWLMGRAAPYFARYLPDDLPTPDPEEHGRAALPLWALWRERERLDTALARLAEVRVVSRSEALSPVEALTALAHEQDVDTSHALSTALGHELGGPVRALGSVYAGAVDRAAGRGFERLTTDAELAAADGLLAATAEPVRDVLDWATLRVGRPRRKRPALGDLLRVLRNAELDDLARPANDPWPTLRRFRDTVGWPMEAEVEVAGPSGWFGSWALRGRTRRVVGVAAWPGPLRLRFALQGLGRLDALAQGGRGVLLPRDAAAAQLPSALYPLWFCERLFQEKALKSRAANADTGRLAALAEILLHRAQAALVKLWATFDSAREVGAVLESVPLLSHALGVQIAPEVGLLLAAPWSSGPSAWPSATLAAAALGRRLRAELDVDYWRNPRCVEPLRQLASRTAEATLVDLVPGEPASWVPEYRAWAEEVLGA
jgi:hypothetical protein